MGFAKDKMAPTAMGGTELMKYGLSSRIPDGLLDDFQIFLSRVHEELDPNKIKIYWHHDLPWDPAATHLKETWHQFDHIVYNSNWQADMFNKVLGVPYHRSSVLENAIEPIEYKVKPSRTDGIIRIIYHTTPHRGLELLVPVFEKLCEKHDNIQLDVYSSFKIYGWGERDAQYEALFERCKNHPKINYHGSVPNTEIRAALQDADIFAYPSIWVESSCISMMEAMSAGVICVHPNYGALYETSGCLTRMYGWHEDPNQHAGRHLAILDETIEDVKAGRHVEEANYVKAYADLRFNWKRRAYQWQTLLEKLKTEKPASKFITLKS